MLLRSVERDNTTIWSIHAEKFTHRLGTPLVAMRGHLLPEARALWEDVRGMVGRLWRHLSWIPEEGEAAVVHEFCEA